MSFYDLKAVDGKHRTLDFGLLRDKVVLVVNVASLCGYTPQYQALQALYDEFGPERFVILAFPCNQFASQEPGNNETIQEFVRTKYGVTFPILEKVTVNGPRTHPLYAYLKNQKPGSLGFKNIKWNFEKFLINRQGAVVARFPSEVSPEQLRGHVQRLLLDL